MAEILITSSVLILVLTVLRYLLRGKFPLRLQYGMWAVVALRLLVPVSVGSLPVSVLNALPDNVGALYVYYTGDIGPAPAEPAASAAPAAPAASAPSAAPAHDPGTAAGGQQAAFPGAQPGIHVSSQLPSENSLPANTTAFSLSGLLAPIRYMGMAAMAGWFLWVNLSFRRKLRETARRVEAPDCPLPVFTAEDIPSPCLVGLFRPAIYVTPACLEDEARLRHVLAHELTHWRHKDHLWSLVRCLCLTVYWFDPLVWLAASLSRRDCELACDEGALVKLGEEERTAYGRTLIGLMAESASPVHLLQTATTMVDRKRGIKERLLLIAKKPMVLAVTTVAVVLAVGIAVACTFTGAVKPDESPQPDDGYTDQVESPQPANTYTTLDKALADIPKELLPSEEHPLSGITAYTPEGHWGETLGPTLNDGELFRAYFVPALIYSSNLEDPLGWMASVYRLGQEDYDAIAQSAAPEGTYWSCFATDGHMYYAIHAPTRAPEIKEGLTEGKELQNRLTAWLREAVLSTQGISFFDGAYRGDNTRLITDIGGGMYQIHGYDADAITWLAPTTVVRTGQLYFANPRFLGTFFADKVVQGSAELADGVITVSFTVDGGTGSGTVDGPHVQFRADARGSLVDYSFTPWAGQSVSLSEAEMVQIAQALREIIHFVNTRTTELSADDLNWFNTQFFNHYEDERRMNNMLLNSSYDAPNYIDLYWLFYDGVPGVSNEITPQERALLEQIGTIDLELDLTKVTTAQMDAVLREKTGLALSDMHYPLTGFVYLAEFDAYYHTHGDTNFAFCTVTGGRREADGRVVLEYEMEGRRTVTLLPDGDGYLFLSNTGEFPHPSVGLDMDSTELDAYRQAAAVAPGDRDWPDDPTPAAIARVLSEKYFGAYTRVSPNSFFHLDTVEIDSVSVYDMDDFFAPTEICFDVWVVMGGKILDDMGGWQAGQGMDYLQDGPYAGKWIEGWQCSAKMDGTGRWKITGVGSGGYSVDYDGIPIPDINSCRDFDLMYFLLNVADGAPAEAAQHELGSRFLSRPEDILNIMTWFNGAQPQNWPDSDMDGADWLVQMLVSEFKVMRSEEDARAFEEALAGFADEDCGGMARNVRTAWENYAEP